MRGFLADETAHLIGKLGIPHIRQRLVERLDEPMLGRGQHDVEEIDHCRCHGMAGDPLHRDVGQVEMNLAGLDLYRAWIDFLVEAMRSQHASGV